jgi:uncharacterized protein YejL (UPF0352 family)
MLKLTISEHYQLQQLADKYSDGDVRKLARNIIALVDKEDAIRGMSTMYKGGDTCDKQ